MTAVVGILNKRGVAIAADSAVTRTRPNEQKITKNGNKMLRLSNCVPISVMITGSASFLTTPWDIVIRRYRQQRGDIRHKSVEECVDDVFNYIASNNIFWEHEWIESWIEYELEDIIKTVHKEIPEDVCSLSKRRPKTYLQHFTSNLNKLEKGWLKNGIAPQFEGYSSERFHEYAHGAIDNLFEDNLDLPNELDDDNDSIVYNLILPIKERIESALMSYLTSKRKDGNRTQLIFAGFGEEDEYPSLIAAEVVGGFDNRVNYHIPPENIVKINDKRPAAICPFAQSDVADSILSGVHRTYIARIKKEVKDSYGKIKSSGFNGRGDDAFDAKFFIMLRQVEVEDLLDKFNADFIQRKVNKRSVWEKTLKDYDLQSMASLAHNLINLTGFHRILTFKQEGVGGPVDLAIISKAEGFTWLSRKSWYHHKDVNGQYGKFGV